MRIMAKRGPAGQVYLAAQLIAGACIFGVVTTGRAIWVGADELRKAARVRP